MPFTIKITEAGRIALINAENNGTAPVTIAEVGISETAVVPDPAATVLPGEVKRITTISGEVVSADTMHVSIFDDTGDTYSMRSFAIYLDEGTLFGIYGQPDPIIEKTAASIASLVVDVRFVDVDAASVTFGDTTYSNPPASETRQGVAELATQAEANGGTDDQRIITALKAKNALLAWLLTLDGAGSGIDADLLDGQHGSFYTNIPARLGYTPLNAAAFTAAAVRAMLLTVDGAGSGIDADLLDGLDASAFLKAIDATRYGSNSAGWWEKRANGLIEQGGYKAGPWTAEPTVPVSLPLPIGSEAEILDIQLTPSILSASAARDLWCQVVRGTITGSGFTVQLQAATDDKRNLDGFYWRMIAKAA